MLFGTSNNQKSGMVQSATVFREDGTATLVQLQTLEFDRCVFTSEITTLTPGDYLRLHMRGQGWIRMEVRSISNGLITAAFVTESAV